MVLKGTDLGSLIYGHINDQEKTAGLKNKQPSTGEAVKISEGLAKIASLPYNEEAYRSVQEMMKTASKCIGELTKSIESINSRNSDLEKAADVRSMLDGMIDLGAVDEFSVQEKVAELMSKDSRQIEIIKEAMNLLKDGKEGNVFFEIDKTAGISDNKKGMFDGVID